MREGYDDDGNDYHLLGVLANVAGAGRWELDFLFSIVAGAAA